MPDVESSAVSHVSYDHAKKIRFVTFRRSPKIHAYFGVPPGYRLRELTPVRLHG